MAKNHTQYIFTCKSITPIFMYGADGKTPELRPASIKGVMRFWWRAINVNLRLKDLKSQEADIFGDTDRRSSFSVRVKENLQTENTNPLPHKKKGDKGYHQKSAFKVNQTFQIIFTGKNLELIENIFKLSTILGGFGNRSRRGFGSIQIDEINQIEEFINTIPTFGDLKTKSRDEEYPYINNIEVGKTYNNYQDLLETIGKASHNHNDDALGSASPRLASPIYVSILKFSDKDYRPIITTLNNRKSNNGGKVDSFKKAIL